MRITAADGTPIKLASAEYHRRNLLHCKAVGVSAGIEAAYQRLMKTARPQRWLLKLLVNELAKAVAVADEMARHRDEVK